MKRPRILTKRNPKRLISQTGGFKIMDQVKERRVPVPSGHVVYSATGELITSGNGLSDTNPSPDASAPAIPNGASRRVFFDITQR